MDDRKQEDEEYQRKLALYEKIPWDKIKPGMTETPKRYLVEMGASVVDGEIKARVFRQIYEEELKKPNPQRLVELKKSIEAHEKALKEAKFRLNLLETLIADGKLTCHVNEEGAHVFIFLDGGLSLDYIINKIKVKDTYTNPKTFADIDEDGQLFRLMDKVAKRTYQEPKPKKEEPKPVEQPPAPKVEEKPKDDFPEEEIPEVNPDVLSNSGRKRVY